MDRTERIAQKYLESLALGAVRFEPDGNVPPDFLITCQRPIAVEVRRLNQADGSSSGAAQGLESLDIPLRRNVQKLLSKSGHPAEAESWWVSYRFRRPLEPWRNLKPKIEQALAQTLQSNSRKEHDYRLTECFRLTLDPADESLESTLVFGASLDMDAGGWVLLELDRNLRLCVAEKERKVATFRTRYPAWWLVLVDHIDDGVPSGERERVRQTVTKNLAHSFDRIVLLDPAGSNEPFVL